MAARVPNLIVASGQDSPPEKLSKEQLPEEDELDYWARQLNVTREELRSAVQLGGPETWPPTS